MKNRQEVAEDAASCHILGPVPQLNVSSVPVQPLKPQTRIVTDYRTESSYFALHAGVGKIFKQKGSNRDVYGRFFWARHGGDTAHLSSGEDCRFDSVSSSRIRIGTGWTKDLGKASAFYVREAWAEK